MIHAEVKKSAFVKDNPLVQFLKRDKFIDLYVSEDGVVFEGSASPEDDNPSLNEVEGRVGTGNGNESVDSKTHKLWIKADGKISGSDESFDLILESDDLSETVEVLAGGELPVSNKMAHILKSDSFTFRFKGKLKFSKIVIKEVRIIKTSYTITDYDGSTDKTIVVYKEGEADKLYDYLKLCNGSFDDTNNFF